MTARNCAPFKHTMTHFTDLADHAAWTAPKALPVTAAAAADAVRPVYEHVDEPPPPPTHWHQQADDGADSHDAVAEESSSSHRRHATGAGNKVDKQVERCLGCVGRADKRQARSVDLIKCASREHGHTFANTNNKHNYTQAGQTTPTFAATGATELDHLFRNNSDSVQRTLPSRGPPEIRPLENIQLVFES